MWLQVARRGNRIANAIYRRIGKGRDTMLLSIEGDEATGKTSLAYTAPLRIVGFAFDMGHDRALMGTRHDFFEGLNIKIIPYLPTAEVPVFEADITIFELPQPIQMDPLRVRGCRELWNYFIVRCVKALTDPQVRSVVVDTMTVARRIKADAHLEGLQSKAFDEKGMRKKDVELRERLLQIEYGVVNDSIRDIYTTGSGVRKNLIAIHHLTDERADRVDRDGRVEKGVPTGKRILEGLTGTYKFVDVAIRMEKQRGELVGLWVKCGYNLATEGTRINNPCWDTLVNIVEMGLGGRLKLEHRNNA